jgi:hypothetical protein
LGSLLSGGKVLKGVLAFYTKTTGHSLALSNLSIEVLEDAISQAASITGQPLPWEGCLGFRISHIFGGPPNLNPLLGVPGVIWIVPEIGIFQSGVPVITKVTFPSAILGNKKPVPGTVEFTDSNAGVNWAQFDVESDTCGGCFKSFGFDPNKFDPKVKKLTKGKFKFHMWCEHEKGFTWSMKVTLRDIQRHVSKPYRFSVKCNPVSAGATKSMTREMSAGGGGGP